MLNQSCINSLSEYNEPTREKKVELFPHAHFALFSAGAMPLSLQFRPPPQLSTAIFSFFLSVGFHSVCRARAN